VKKRKTKSTTAEKCEHGEWQKRKLAKNKPMTNKEPKIDDFSEPITESNAVRIFRAKCETALAKVNNLQQFREADAMVDYVFKVGRELFDTPLDKQNTDRLIRTGGKLTGAYVYLGQKSSYARAQRDVYAQKASEMEKERLLELLRDGEKVTEARSKVAFEMTELQEYVIQMDVAKNQWENITEAVEKMVSFIQSAIKVKEGERFQSGRLQDNAG